MSTQFTFGKPSYNSNDVPFFIKSESNNIIIDNEIEQKLEILKFSDEIKEFYKHYSTSSQELYIGNWSLFSINNIIKMTEHYISNNIETIDIAFTYIGMGHIRAAFYHPTYNKILYRIIINNKKFLFNI